MTNPTLDEFHISFKCLNELEELCDDGLQWKLTENVRDEIKKYYDFLYHNTANSSIINECTKDGRLIQSNE